MNFNQIRDLEYNDVRFYDEAAAWTLSSYYGSDKASYCGDTYLLGGYKILGGEENQYFERIYKNLPGHTAIYFSFKAWIIDSWDANEGDRFQFSFDGYVFNGPVVGHGDYDQSFLADKCGTPGNFFNGYHTYKDLNNILFSGTIGHIASTLTFRVISQLNEDTSDESFGIREVNFMFLQSTASFSTAVCTSSAISLATDCSCAQGKYKSTTFPYPCLTCHSYCSSCFGPAATDCYGCNAPYVWDGSKCIQCDANCNGCYGEGKTNCLSCAANKFSFKTTTCLDTCNYPLKADTTTYQCKPYCNPDEFLYWDNSCSPNCDYPLRRSSQTSTSLSNVIVLTCTYPCASTEYLYWDGFCRSTCADPPLTQRAYKGYNFCDFPCTNSAQPIVYWNKTCLAACNPPLSYAIIYGKQFCQYPCASTERLYNNGSCIAGPSCQQYFKSYTNNIENRCDYPCTSTQSLYSNGTCLPQTCQIYYKAFSLSGDHYCNYPCLPTEHLYNNGTCLSTCDWRFTLYNTNTAEKHCDYRCSTSQYLFLNNTCLDNCPPYYNAWHDKVTGDKYCDRPCQPAEFLYSNGSCLSSCQPYYNQVTYTSDQFCNYPCEPNEYLYSNGTCIGYCHPHFTPISIGQDKFCNYPCASSEYLNYDGKCVSSCDPLLDDPRTYGTDNFCYSRCKEGDYLYENGTCLSSCPPDFKIASNGQYLFCNYPCSNTEHLHNNGTCLSSCDPPFISNIYSGNQFCSFPCSHDDYLHDNGTCLSSCNSLFVQEIVSDGKEKYCHYPCSSPTDYIYWNGTCLSSCVSPYHPHIEGSYRFCQYSCSTDEYLYWNGTCNHECKFPLMSRSLAGLNYCHYPCSSAQYLLWNGSCVSSCQIPSRIKNQAVGALCVLPCEDPDDYYYETTGECRSECDMKVTIQDNLFRKCVPYDPSEGKIIKFLSTPPTESGSITLSALPKTIHYLRFVNISYPLRVQRIAQSKGMNPISYVYIVPVAQQSTSNPTSHQILTLYDKYGLSSSFIVNFWPEILLLGGILGLVILLFIAEVVFSYFTMTFWKNLAERVRIILGWNLAILLLSTNIGDIILYCTLELRTFELDSSTAIISFLLCLTTIGLVAGILFLSGLLGSRVYVMQQNSIKLSSPSTYSQHLNNWRCFQIVYRGFTDNKLANSLFYLIYIVRSGLPIAIATNFYMFPMIQTSLYLLISVAILRYIAKMKPIKKYINHLQLLFLEIIVFVVNIGIFILALLERLEVNNDHARVFIGDVIVVCSFLINLLAPIFLLAKLSMTIRAAIKLKQLDSQKSKAVLLQALFLPFQQAGFGFEQVQIVSFSNTYAHLPQFGESKPNRLVEALKRFIKPSKNAKVGNVNNDFEVNHGESMRIQSMNTTLQTFGNRSYMSSRGMNSIKEFKSLRNKNSQSSKKGIDVDSSEASFPLEKILTKK